MLAMVRDGDGDGDCGGDFGGKRRTARAYMITRGVCFNSSIGSVLMRLFRRSMRSRDTISPVTCDV